MQHMVNKALTRWVAANLRSGHLAHTGNHRHGTAGHNQGRRGLGEQQMRTRLETSTRKRAGISTHS